MRIDSKLKEKVEKLLPLAERGVAGEKENAKGMLKNLLKTSGLSLSDFTDKEIDLEPPGEEDKNLLNSREYKPGIYDDISHVEYNSMPSEIIRNSYLNGMEKCPAEAKAENDIDTPSLLRGRAAHALILEGDAAFEKEFTVAPTCDRRTKEGKKIWAMHMADNLGKTVIKEEEYVRIMGMNMAVRSHPTAVELLENGISEQTVIWKDEETGLMCRCRPDRVPSGNYPLLVDLKGTKDATNYGFDKAIATYRYFRQAAMYTEGISKITGDNYEAFALIAVEWDFPHMTDVVMIDPDYLAEGRRQFHELLRLEKQCRENNYWPHFVNRGARDSFMPPYMGR